MSGVDRYELQDEIGRGESGVVFRARDRLTGRLVAIKVFRSLPATAGGREALARRLEREARLLARVRHPAVVEVIEAKITEDSAWLVTEYVEGETLQAVLRLRERLTPEEAIALVVQAARALACAHAHGIVHRDVKPANLLVREDGTLKVTDFGVAGEAGSISSGAGEREYFLGTPAYVAPEQWLGNPIDGRADLYSLGVVLYRCLTGSRPFEGRTVRELAHRSLSENVQPPSLRGPRLPAMLDELCLKALARDPADRFMDGEAMARALEEIVVPRSGEAALSADSGWMDDPMERTWQRLYVQRTESSFWRTGILAAASVLAVVAALSFPGGFSRSARQPESELDRAAGGTMGVDGSEPSLPQELLATPLPVPDGAMPRPGEALDSVKNTGPRPGRYRNPDRSMITRYAELGSRAAVPSTRVADSKRPTPREVARRTTQVDEVRLPPPPRMTPPRMTQEDETRLPVEVPATERAASESREGEGFTQVEGRIRIYHSLDEGMLEVLVDGRRAALVRFGVDVGQRPGEPVHAEFMASPGGHSVQVRVLSASQAIDASSGFEAEWSGGETASLAFALERGRRGWKLSPR